MKTSADSFRSLCDGLLRTCNVDLSACSTSEEARWCFARLARRRAELVETEPLRWTPELRSLKERALERAGDLLISHEVRIFSAGRRRVRVA